MSSETEKWCFYGLWLLVALSSQLRNYLSLSFLIPLFSLPTFAPHLNKAAVFVKEKKKKWNESTLHKGHKMNRFPTLNSFKMNDYLAN